MKETKFRAWNKRLKQMSESFTIEDLLRVEAPLLSASNMTDEIIYMQYTGLHDKNGKEIYEGDILRFENLPDLDIVEATDGGWNPFIDSMETDGAWHYEVIGNIYSNPELLEVKCKE